MHPRRHGRLRPGADVRLDPGLPSTGDLLRQGRDRDAPDSGATGLVVDASVALTWLIEEGGSEAALSRRDHDLCAPSLLRIEAANVFRTLAGQRGDGGGGRGSVRPVPDCPGHHRRARRRAEMARNRPGFC